MKIFVSCKPLRSAALDIHKALTRCVVTERASVECEVRARSAYLLEARPVRVDEVGGERSVARLRFPSGIVHGAGGEEEKGEEAH
jgi:hypothetical protein